MCECVYVGGVALSVELRVEKELGRWRKMGPNEKQMTESVSVCVWMFGSVSVRH